MRLFKATAKPRFRLELVAACACLLTMALAACGGSSSGSGESTGSNESSPTAATNKEASKNLTLPDVCSLVTTDDVATLWQVDKSQILNVASGAGAGLCIYGNQASQQDGLLVIGQAYPDATTAEQVQPEQLATVYSRFYGISSSKSVTGIGDKAFEYVTTSTATGSNGAAIFVFKANILLMIILSPATDDTGVESLAKAALTRLS